MTDQEMRIAIAEACGLERDGSVTPTPSGQPIFREWWQSTDAFRAHSIDDLPDYLNDLNAMHEAEKLFSDEQVQQYVEHLVTGTNARFKVGTHTNIHLWNIYHSTARQRAEAFLKAIGKWKE